MPIVSAHFRSLCRLVCATHAGDQDVVGYRAAVRDLLESHSARQRPRRVRNRRAISPRLFEIRASPVTAWPIDSSKV